MMKKNSRVAQLLGVEYPVLSAGMSWVTSAELAAAVSNAGGFGILGPNAGQTELTTDPVETAERMRAEIRKTRSLTDKPFGAELMIFGEPGPFDEPLFNVYLEEDIQAVLCLNDVPQEWVDKLHAAGKKCIHKDIFATVASFKKAEKMGYDAVVVAGVDCGGHSNTKDISTITAIRIAKEATSLPVIAAGGIIDGLTVQIAGMLGAEGVYVGTRFVASKECTVAQVTKDKMVELTTDDLMQVEGIFGPIMSLPTPSIKKAHELMEESHGKNALEITNTYGGGYRTGMLLGDFENGLLDVSAAIGQIKSILSVQEIMDEFAKGME